MPNPHTVPCIIEEKGPAGQEDRFMVQKAKKNEEIEKVVNVFQDYIMTSPYIEWLWSDKLGYILMQISIKKQDIGESRIISDADML